VYLFKLLFCDDCLLLIMLSFLIEIKLISCLPGDLLATSPIASEKEELKMGTEDTICFKV
jgi:hypothetical protein